MLTKRSLFIHENGPDTDSLDVIYDKYPNNGAWAYLTFELTQKKYLDKMIMTNTRRCHPPQICKWIRRFGMPAENLVCRPIEYFEPSNRYLNWWCYFKSLLGLIYPYIIPGKSRYETQYYWQSQKHCIHVNKSYATAFCLVRIKKHLTPTLEYPFVVFL